MPQFNVNAIDLKKSVLNTSAPLRWRRMLLAACVILATFSSTHQAAARSDGSNPVNEAIKHIDPISAYEVGKFLGVDPNSVNASNLSGINEDSLVAKASKMDAAHALVAANSVFLLEMSSTGVAIASGSGTFIRGTDQDGVPGILTVRHVGDAKNLLGTASDKVFYGVTLAFNSQGQFLGTLSEKVVNLLQPGEAQTDDAPMVAFIDMTKPHNQSLLDQISGVPLASTLPVGPAETYYGGPLMVAPGSSGGGIIVIDGDGNPGLVAVVQGTDAQMGHAIEFYGHDLASESTGDNSVLSVSFALTAGTGLTMGIGSPTLLHMVHDGVPRTLSGNFNIQAAWSFNYANGIFAYTENIDMQPFNQKIDFPAEFASSQGEVESLQAALSERPRDDFVGLKTIEKIDDATKNVLTTDLDKPLSSALPAPRMR